MSGKDVFDFTASEIVKSIDKTIDINSLKKELFNLKIMKKSGQLTDTSQFKKVKKQIASLLTKERLNKNA